jgi:uncharacterized protein (TIGR02145 family)
MAWATKYRLEIKDFHEYDWSVDIEEDGFGGSIIDLVGSSDPINIQWENGSDDIFDPLQPSTCSITVKSLTDFALADLYSVDDLHFRVSVYQNGSLYWQGYIITGQYGEPYEYTPYDVTINAWCGLGLLKDKQGMYNETTYYTGRVQASEILFGVLSKINVTNFYEYVNLYDVTHYTTDLDSPFVQTTIDADLFRDMYCDEVLYRVLSRFNARIIHKDGAFRIYRPVELAELTVYGRWFTDPGTWSATTYSTAQFIKRGTRSSNLLQVPGGDLMIIRPASKVTASQDYGNKQSWIDNWEINSDTYKGDPDFTYDSWTRSGIWGLNHIADLIPGEVDGMVLTADADPVNDDYVYQDFGLFGIASAGDVLVLSFDYLFYNTDTAGDPANLIIQITDSAGNYLYEVDDYHVDWTASVSYIVIADAGLPLGKTGWNTYERRLIGLTAAGPYTIKIFQIQAVAGVYGGIKNIRFYDTNDTIVMKTKKRKFFQRIRFSGSFGEWNVSLKKKYYPVKTIKDQEEITENTYTKSNAINGQELEYDYILGDVEDVGIDNVLEQFAGALGSYDYVGMTHGITSSWSTKTGAEALPIRQLLCDEIASEYSRPKQMIQMPIIDNGTGASAVNILGHFQDDLNQYSGNNRRFVFNRGSFSVRFRKWEIDLAEVFAIGGTPGEDPGDPSDPESFPGSGWGAYYNYAALVNAHGLAPAGWHVATKANWEDIIDSLGGASVAGGHLKDTSAEFWTSPNTGADNSSGLNCRGVGFRSGTIGTFGSRKAIGDIWTSDAIGPNAYELSLNYNDAGASISFGDKKNGLPVRMIKDDDTLADMTDYDGHVYHSVKIGSLVIITTNFCCEHYADGTAINIIADNSAWSSDTAGAMGFYDNDIALINSILNISGAVHNTTISVSFSATSPAAVSQEVYWQVRNSSDLVRSSGNETVSISSGTANYSISVDIPNETGTQYYVMIGKTSSPTLESNRFTIT